MSVDIGQLKSWLAQSKLQKDNNSLYQTIKNMIDNLEETNQSVRSLSSGSSGGSAQLSLFPEVLLLGFGKSKVPPQVTTSNKGLVPVLSGTATQYLDGSGNWSVPAGSGGTTADFLGAMLLGGM